ncbi:hypothetical protein Hanom_Chr08g00720721 [Helianthus anomalus]
MIMMFWKDSNMLAIKLFKLHAFIVTFFNLEFAELKFVYKVVQGMLYNHI